MAGSTDEPLDEKIQERIKRVKDSVGDETVEVLKEQGLNVDEALKDIVTEQVKKEEHQEQEKRALIIEGLPLADCMTSELVILYQQTNDSAYQEELQRRFDLLGLTEEQQGHFIESERERVRDRPFPSLYPGGLARHYFLMDGVGIEDLPAPEQCLASELIVLTDDAQAAWVRDHHWLKEKTMNAVAKIIGRDGEPIYYREQERRMKEWGWTRPQEASFTKNECLLTARIKWRYHNDPAWQAETMVTQRQVEEEDRRMEEARQFRKSLGLE